MSETPSSLFAVLSAVREDGRVRIGTPGASAPNIRLCSAIHMLRELLARREADAPGQGRRLNLLQFDDDAHHRLPSVGFGRRVGRFPLVALIVDPYFYFTRGFAELREMAQAERLPAWSERAAVLFWRGRASHNGVAADGRAVVAMADVPRVAAALHFRGDARADIGLIGPWIQPLSDEETLAYFEREGVLRPSTPMPEHARYKFQLDIDGVANAWATLERFLCGSCVLKVESRFEMWFYDRLRPWEHYVPVRADLSDVDEKLDWCLAHDEAARAIAQAGRALALSLTYEAAVTEAVRRIAATEMMLD